MALRKKSPNSVDVDQTQSFAGLEQNFLGSELLSSSTKWGFVEMNFKVSTFSLCHTLLTLASVGKKFSFPRRKRGKYFLFYTKIQVCSELNVETLMIYRTRHRWQDGGDCLFTLTCSGPYMSRMHLQSH